MIISGKAHPRNSAGKVIIKKIIALSKDPDLRHKIVFLEEYDMPILRFSTRR
jgi:starch phosphorylase